MFRWLKKKNNINPETYFPSVKELNSISKEQCLKEILKAHKRHRIRCYIPGSINDDLIKFLEDKGYTVRKIVGREFGSYKGVEINFY